MNAVDNNYATPLHITAHYGLTELAEILIANGANLNEVSKRGTTPLKEAEISSSKEVMELLIKHGAQK